MTEGSHFSSAHKIRSPRYLRSSLSAEQLPDGKSETVEPEAQSGAHFEHTAVAFGKAHDTPAS